MYVTCFGDTPWRVLRFASMGTRKRRGAFVNGENFSTTTHLCHMFWRHAVACVVYYIQGVASQVHENAGTVKHELDRSGRIIRGMPVPKYLDS